MVSTINEQNNSSDKASPSLASNTESFSALIVDDDHSFLKLLGLSLSLQPEIGVIDSTDNGTSAIEKAKANDYDLIFIDAIMPGIDGYEICTQLRAMPKYKHTPIIMVTGLTSPMDEGRGIIAGTTKYITKPIQQTAFKEVINRELTLLKIRKKLNPTDSVEA